MFGLPETPIIEDNEKGKLIASISITREPEGCEPFIAISYEVSLRVFGIALALAKMEGSLNKGIIEQNQAQSSQNGNQSDNENNEDHEDYSKVTKENKDTDSSTDNTDDNGDKSLAGKKKRRNGTA